MTGYGVLIGDLRTMAEGLDKRAEAIEGHGNTAGGIDFGIDTFGIIGQIFCQGARIHSQNTAAQYGRFAGYVRDAAVNMRDTADTYQGLENFWAAAFGKGAK